jgi:hypothetical protein
MDIIRFLNLKYFFSQIIDIFTDSGNFAGPTSFFSKIAELWYFVVPYLKFFSTLISLILTTLAIYAYVRLKQVKAEEKEKYSNYYEPLEGEVNTNTRWEKVVNLVNSENQSDWKLAVIEADIILDEILTAQSYHGDTIGDKLKAIEPSDFLTLNQAWEAHKIRNTIAHGSGDFILTQREARRVIGLYEAVFREFKFI